MTTETMSDTGAFAVAGAEEQMKTKVVSRHPLQALGTALNLPLTHKADDHTYLGEFFGSQALELAYHYFLGAFGIAQDNAIIAP